MPMVPYPLLRPLLFRLDPEQAHDLTLGLLARGQNTPFERLWRAPTVADPVVVAGMRFPNRLGLAAGLDKNGRCIDALGGLGFGFLEIGTVTPKAQPGNPKPRIFRLTGASALINRLGFNNDGLGAFIANIARASFRQRGGIVGLNIGKNLATPIERATDDYLACLDGVYPHADYVVLNVSSPNTRDLRSLQQADALRALFDAVLERREALTAEHGRQVPIFLKIAPDLDDAQIAGIAATLLGQRLDGVIATNTSTSRDAVSYLPHGGEAGGLSGAPLRAVSNRVIARLRMELGPAFPIVGVGGVMSPADALAKRQAGADLVQIYTGLIYHGPALVASAARALAHGTTR